MRVTIPADRLAAGGNWGTDSAQTYGAQFFWTHG